ncbi:MAG: phosphoenolpyruvate synthase [Lachnospiraceae bacterium]|nr:phosphoenolpyruvate synthase [Lachnospiraceae bacterium]
MYKFCTKAETLYHLYNNCPFDDKDTILKPVYFGVDEWAFDPVKQYERVKNALGNVDKLIVRSSAANEDNEVFSLAGKYTSVICKNSEDAFGKAVDEVISSYGEPVDGDNILVQRAIENVDCSGVIFTRDPNSGGRYYVINYDDTTGSTSSVTSGKGDKTKLLYWFPGKKRPKTGWADRLCAVVECIEEHLGWDTLDMEFLIKDESIHILQVRPLCMNSKAVDAAQMYPRLKRISESIRQGAAKKPFLYGKKTIYGVMPDWNPAEMIGIHPKNLAISLYKELITDNVWAYQRDNYGYANLRSFPLMLSFEGYPYIDVRVSFNSFIPDTLRPETADKLLNYYLDRLEESPEKHDRVEFEIVFSCYTFDLPERVRILEQYGFSEDEITEIVDSLRSLTNNVANSKNGLWRKDIGKLAILQKRYDEIVNSSLSEIEKIYWLVADCKRYGTLPFAGLARAAFIAVQMLKSMVAGNILSMDEYEAFINDIETESSLMNRDLHAMSKDEFLRKYGFLRPGTYDICSKRYDEAPDLYFDFAKTKSETLPDDDGKPSFRLTLQQMAQIREALNKHMLADDVLGLFQFIKTAIESREHAKFIFTRNVSEILRLYKEWGSRMGFDAKDIAYADIQVIKELYCGTCDEVTLLENSIKKGKASYNEGLGIVLPPLIVDESDVWEFHIPDTVPTYITQKQVSAPIVCIESFDDLDINDRILLIPSADPGFDWIFSHNIKGFITEYGGANSHMAIRAGELGIPAVIGVGQKMYDKLKKSDTVEIMCPLKQINVLK